HHPGRPVDEALKAKLIDALDAIAWDKLDNDMNRFGDYQRLELLRIYMILFNRYGPPSPEQQAKVLAKLSPHFPDPQPDRLLNGDLCQVLVYLQSPEVAAKSLKLMAQAPTQEEQMEYARALRMLRAGWTPDLRQEYFRWFLKAANFKGGMSFTGFM